MRALGEIEGLERDDEVVSTRAALDYALAAVSYRQMRYEDAIAYADRAIEDAESIGDHEAVARASYVAGGAYDDLGREGGRPYLERAIQIYEGGGATTAASAPRSTTWAFTTTPGGVGTSRWRSTVSAARPTSARVIRSTQRSKRKTRKRRSRIRVTSRRRSRSSGRWSGSATPRRSPSVLRRHLDLGRVAARAGRFTEAHDLYRQAIRGFDKIDARRYVTETKARTAECLVFEGGYADAITESSALREAARASPFGGLEALILRQLGLAFLWQARKPTKRAWTFVQALAIGARELKAEFEVALTLRAMADVRFDASEELRSESNAILERLGVVSVPAVPLP